jgi:hypothetical protein
MLLKSNKIPGNSQRPAIIGIHLAGVKQLRNSSEKVCSAENLIDVILSPGAPGKNLNRSTFVIPNSIWNPFPR